MKMKKRSTALVVFLLSVAIAISVCVMPAFAKINCESESTYDYDSASPYFGEEIQAKVIINPGENEVKDMRIEIFEADALLDDGTFEHTISPTGADIIVTREGHTFFCEELRIGESITLMFNAYPKTITEEEIKVADVRISYSQLGQRLEDSEEVKANLEKSFWFRYEDAEKRASSANWMFYVGLILAIIAGVSLFIQWFGRGKREKEKDEISQNWRKNLEDISKKLELAKDNPTEMESLKRKVERDIKSIKIKEEKMGKKKV